MRRIFIPARQPEDWQHLLAEPEKHWKTGYSARTLAHCWQAADGFPDEVNRAFVASGVEGLHPVTPLLILPEYKVPLKGQGADSQNDIFVLAKVSDGALMSIMVEGKVEESFGVPLGRWKLANQGLTENKQRRLDDLQEHIGLKAIPDDIYYQLLHRTACAMIEARRFNAPHALMLVHSFSPHATGFTEYAHFLSLFEATAEKGRVQPLKTVEGITLYAAWVTGNPRFLTA